MAETPFVRRYGETDFITGLRAIAASMVVVIHTGAFSGFGPMGSAVTGLGKYGVDIFFVISGFTVAKTFAEAPSYRAYLTRRMFRIAPIYWAVILLCFVLASQGLFVSPWMEALDGSADGWNLGLQLTFLSYLDYRVAASLLGVEWTIPVEVFWYIVLPFLLFATRSWKMVLGFSLALLFLTAIFGYASKQIWDTTLPIRWSPVAYGHWFLIGAYCFHSRAAVTGADPKRLAWACRAAVLLIVPCAIFDFDGRGEIFTLMVAVLMVAASRQATPWIVATLTARPFLVAGSISYSIYLLHMLVIAMLAWTGLTAETTLAHFLMVYALTMVASMATYAWIERPTNNFGRQIVSDRLQD
jgi:peptidoglycan/LPS O-acetylase OafA/YrhL